MKNKALFVAGLIFLIVAIAHLLRYYFKVEMLVGNYVFPMDMSLVGAVVAGVLAIWMFVARRGRN